MTPTNDKVDQSGADEREKFESFAKEIGLIYDAHGVRSESTVLELCWDTWNAGLKAQTAQAVARDEPKYADFANGDAAMWTENGKLKSEWNEAAPQQAVAASYPERKPLLMCCPDCKGKGGFEESSCGEGMCCITGVVCERCAGNGVVESANQPVQAAPNMHDGAKLLTDSELSDPEHMRAYVSAMHETIDDLKAAQSNSVQAKAMTDSTKEQE